MRKKKSSLSMKRRMIPILIVLMITCMVSVGIIFASSGQSGGNGARGAAIDNMVTDPSTMDSWKTVAEDTTKYTGRVWTDKTVLSQDATFEPAGITVEKGTSDFLVALSALSSTSNIKTTTGGQPLDIVMVLDTSGSMGNNMGYVYEKTYDAGITTNRERRYVYADGQYRRLDIGYDRYEGIYWELDGQRVELKTSENDDDPDHLQMYTRRQLSRIEALKEAVNNFIDATAAENEKISADDEKHRISVVTYASGSNILSALTAYDESNKNDIKDRVDDLDAYGATYADSGMEDAQSVLNEARDGAKKIVIFFTDGEPNHGNGFDGSVADSAIATAKEMKEDGTVIYTIGVFDGADPDGSRNVNRYMNAMSSNYPSAESYTSLGERVSEEAAYYKVAGDSEELNNIFMDISEEIIESAGYPTEIENPSGDPTNPQRDGYITFTDQLGDYMQVDDFKNIVFADKKFSLPAGGKVTSGDTDTYTFEGTAGNSIYPDGNLSSIIITVKHGNDLKTGDLVTVKIPAAMIPLRDFKVDNEDESNVATEVNETYPIRLLYGVGLKDGTAESLSDPDSQLSQYIRENSADGKVSFYSNDFTKGAYQGKTTAQFTPAESNSFYYFTEDAYLYLDEECTIPVTNLQGHENYYYQRVYYDAEETTAQYYSVNMAGQGLEQMLAAAETGENGQYYIPSGTPRLTAVTNLYAQKSNNATQTAADTANPAWNDVSVANAEKITVYLGNNGRMDIELPGTLKVSKTSQAADGFNKENIEDKEFEFLLDLNGTAGTYTAKIFDSKGSQQGSDLTVKDQDTFKLRDGQSISIYGLPDGTEYEVTEQNLPAGFEQTSAAGSAGTIAGGIVSEASFVNTYKAVMPDSVDAAEFFKGAKILDGRDWKAGETFKFVIDAQGDAPATEKTEVQLTARNDGSYADGQEVPFDFGKADFTRPGTYTYMIYEEEPAQKTPGISYSQALYTVIVEVSDDGSGVLQAEAAMTQTTGDDAAGTGTTAETALFTNKYSADSVFAAPVGTKLYTDHSGTKPLSECSFEFMVTPLTEGAPVPAGVSAGSSFTVRNDGTSISYGRMEFTDQHTKTHYDYLLTEVMPQGASAENDYTYNGMKYDAGKYIVRFSPEIVEKEPGKPEVSVKVTYYNTDNGKDPTTELAGARVTFSNEYEPEAAQLAGGDALHGEKTFTGRSMIDGETFIFRLKAGNDATAQAIEKGDIVIEGWDKAAAKAETSVSGAENGVAESFAFGSMTLYKPGVYEFNITEETGNVGGITYDNHTAKVIVTVRDNGQGELEASAVYDNGQADEAEDKAVFSNTYEASLDYGSRGGLMVSKTLNGRDMSLGEFSFAIEAQNGAYITDADKGFTSGRAEDGEKASVRKLSSLKFTTEDIGKTFVYRVYEREGNADIGITYDKSQYEVSILVSDPDLSGQLQAQTTVTRIKDAQGNDDDTVMGVYDSRTSTPEVSFVNNYKAKDETLNTDGLFTKILLGRDWLKTDEFNFTIKAVTDGAPMPERQSVKVTNTGDGESVQFGFGDITFSEEKVYIYEITEEKGNIPGITYSNNKATLQVTVVDNGDGTFTATPLITNREFTNRYSASIDYGDAGGLLITKVLNSRDMEDGKFEFTVKGKDQASREKLSLSEDGIKAASPKAADGQTVTVLDLGQYLELDIEDAGKTYTYEIAETDDKEGGYTYDTAVRTVSIYTEDKSDGRLQVTTTVSCDGEEDKVYTYITGQTGAEKAVVDFENRYGAETGKGGAAILSAKKVLEGRPLKAGEFSFEVKTNSAKPETVMSGSNDEDGNVAFDKKFAYTTESLKKAVKDGYAVKSEADGKDVWTLSYIASEKTDNFAETGLTGVKTSFAFTVTVTDDGKGGLTAEVNYPEDDGMTFRNIYSTGEDVTVNISGNKVLNAEPGLNPPDISGKFSFKLTGSAGAPMPSSDTAVNDGSGNIVFGDVKFSLSMLDGVEPDADGSRTKVFTYEISEAGTVSGIENGSGRQFEITLKDDGKGHLTAEADNAQGALFTFVNTYSITTPFKSSITDTIQITKTLKGADLSEYEFEFELLENGRTVAAGKNDSTGKVTFSAIEYTKPGTHNYVIREVKGDEAGITYDNAQFRVVTEVKDNGDGTLSAVHRTEEASVVFENEYHITEGASVVLSASKIFKGGNLEKGQFTFVLRDENGRVVSTAENDEKGTVVFDEIYYSEEGTYNYTVSEVDDDQKDVDYDETVYNIAVHVKDEDSVLKATVESDSLIFTNVFSADKTPDKDPGDKPDDSNADDSGDGQDDSPVKTGDESGLGSLLAMLAASVLGLIAAIRAKAKTEK